MSRKPISKQLRYRVLERDGYACRYCGVSGEPLQIDHRMPVSKGGTNEFHNLVAACGPCNAGKAADMPVRLIVEQRRMALAATVFQQAGERFGDDMPMWTAFNMLVDFCLMDVEYDHVAEIVTSAATWGEAKNALYKHAGFPPEFWGGDND